MARRKLKRLSEADRSFLARFARRGWLASGREDASEEEICRRAVQAGYLRHEGSQQYGEYRFTAAGESALIGD